MLPEQRHLRRKVSSCEVGAQSPHCSPAAAPLFLLPVESEWPLCLWSCGREAASGRGSRPHRGDSLSSSLRSAPAVL